MRNSFKTPYQTISWGIENLGEALLRAKAEKVLLVTDASFPFLTVKSAVKALPVPYVVFDQFGSNPLYEDVCRGVELFNREDCDTIVAVGGGSSIDVAKCIKLYCKMDPSQNYLRQAPSDSKVPLIAIPTTAGTGSESTRFAVIYFEGAKQSVNHLSIIPKFALLEPHVLATLPVYQRKCTVLDALCQGIESWWSVNATSQSRLLSRKAVELLASRVETYAEGGSDPQLLAEVMEAANYAGQAINLTQTTAPHAFSYKITSLFRFPHGHAVAVCLPFIWEYMIDNPRLCVGTGAPARLEQTFAEIAKALGCSSPRAAVEWFKCLLARLGMEQPRTAEREQVIEALSTSVNPVRLKNNPVPLSQEAINQLYHQIVL